MRPVERELRIAGHPVLLAHSYFLKLDPKQHAKMRPYPPLNTLHAAAVLRNDGLDVAVFDSMLAEDESEFAASLAEHRPTVVVLYEDNFNFLSKMCLTRMREAALTMVGMALGAGCKVAVSGADVTDHPEVYLAAGISGATQHMVGMKGAKNIIAINKDKEAPIFGIADLGIVGDVHKVLPKLLEALQQRG